MQNNTDAFFVYSLEHNYEKENGEDETKSLGIYSSDQRAREAIERYYQLPGFNNYPIECFHVGKFKLDLDTGWTEGFVSSYDLAREFECLTNCFNNWMDIKKTVEQSWEDSNYYNALCEISEKIYKVKEVDELAEHINKIWLKRYPKVSKEFTEYIKIANELFTLLRLK